MEDFPFITENALYRYGRFPVSLRRISTAANLNGGSEMGIPQLLKGLMSGVQNLQPARTDPLVVSTQDLLHNQWI